MFNVSDIQIQNAITAHLEAVFNAEISYTAQGNIPTDANGEPLEEFEFKSNWITFNKLIKDLQEQLGKKIYSIADPEKCRLCIRSIDTDTIGSEKKLTHFIYAIDTLGYDTLRSPAKHRLPIFSEHEIFESLAEFHGIPVKRGAPENDLPVTDLVVSWYGLTEFLTQCRLFVDGTLAGKQGTVYLIEHETKCHDQPARNETRFKIAHELSY